jgi:HEAT repeat protein
VLPQRFASPFVAPQFGVGGMAPAAGGEVDQALQLLSSPRERDRMEAAIALGRGKVEKAIDPLQRLLATDTSPRVREAAARALGLLGSPSALKALSNAAQGDDDRDVRRSAQFAAESIRANTR